MRYNKDTMQRRQGGEIEEETKTKKGVGETESEVTKRSVGSSPGLAGRSQLGPNAPGKHQEPATPNVTLHTLLSSEMASQFS